MNFQTGKRYKTICHCWSLHKCIGYVIIPNFLNHINFVKPWRYKVSLSPFWLVVFAVLAQSVAAMTSLTARVLARPAGRWWSIERDRHYAPFHSTDTWAKVGLCDSFGCYSSIKKCQAELRHELVTGYTVSRYEQFETSPETIAQELRPAVC